MKASPPKKVLFVITKSIWGGAQRYVYDLATHLPKDRFTPVVAAGGDGPLLTRLRDAGIRVIPLALTQHANFFATLFTLAPLFRLVSIMREERPGVVHVNSAKAGGLGALAARIARVPKIVFTVHGWSFLEARNPLVRSLIYFFSWLTALLAHTVIVVSDHDLRIARRMPFIGSKTVRIYNGIDLDAPLGSGEQIRRAFPAGVRITGTVGELTKNKNHLALIEEAREDPEMFVAIVGEGEERSRLISAIRAAGLETRVKLFGFLPAREVLRGFDVFALPSRKEGLPYVLIEARAAGLPIRANRVGGVGEVLDAPDLRVFSLDQMVRETSERY
ncbi:glycosyltransferase [Patescibacteria group bacterium]|nr:glycosyltransferase [Patescibacteria group bacterium]